MAPPHRVTVILALVSTTRADETTALQRRTVATLASTQVLGGVGMSSGLAVGSLLAADLSGSETWAGLGGTTQVLGGALAAMVIARVMAAKGRRPGLSAGYAMAAVGAVVVLAATAVGSFALMLLGTLLFGGATAAGLQARFAATDLAAPETRGRHLSIVVWATTIGSVVGPNLTGPGGALGRALGLPALAGPFVFSLVGLLLAITVLSLSLRPDPLLTARDLAIEHHEPDADHLEGAPTSGLAAIRAHPLALAGVLTMALGHTVMVSVMVMTPLHMRHGHADLEVIGLVISIHVLGMFALSPVTGWAVDRWGGPAVATAGSIILVSASLLAASTPDGHSLRLTVALFLLGLGWSCTLISGSTMLTGAIPLAHRPAAQGLGDVAMGLAGGGGGALAGVVVAQWGYPALGLITAVTAALVGVVLPVIRRRRC